MIGLDACQDAGSRRHWHWHSCAHAHSAHAHARAHTGAHMCMRAHPRFCTRCLGMGMHALACVFRVRITRACARLPGLRRRRCAIPARARLYTCPCVGQCTCIYTCAGDQQRRGERGLDGVHRHACRHVCRCACRNVWPAQQARATPRQCVQTCVQTCVRVWTCVTCIAGVGDAPTMRADMSADMRAGMDVSDLQRRRDR